MKSPLGKVIAKIAACAATGIVIALTAFSHVQAEPATQPAEPPEIKGVIVEQSTIAAADIKLTPKSIQNRLYYDVNDGRLALGNRAQVYLTCKVQTPVPATRAIFLLRLTTLEDDTGADALRGFRQGNGPATYLVRAYTMAREEKTSLNFAVPNLTKPTSSVARIAGRITAVVPCESRAFDLPVDQIGAFAAVDTARFTLVSRVINPNNDTCAVTVSRKWPGETTMYGSPAITGLTADGAIVGPMNLNFALDNFVITFAPGEHKRIKFIRIVATTKVIEVPFDFDIRPQQMM